jgi:photosystem II stability/assembly factor-like uncharacterized protein
MSLAVLYALEAKMPSFPKRGCSIPMNRCLASLALLSAFSLPLLALPPQAATNANPAATAWVPVGPDGGDARSFASDPSDSRHLYLGTTNSWLYESRDGGASWHRLTKLSPKDDLMVDNIVVDEADSKTIYVATWVVDHPDGALFISHDSGKSWIKSPAMDGQSIRALAQASSNPKVLVVGTLKGVFRSEDGGLHWDQISPANSAELHEVESIAIDPKDAKTIYAGTWHLPWKTTDGGANWHNIKQGLIDDSDVFSIIIDPTNPQTVYTSACSGIYKSENGGELYHKIQGIPSTARRTRVLMQDPVDQSMVYAGTTEGLYRTSSAGTNWTRLTGPDVIINDVYVDPKNPRHVLLATDRSGVLMSNDQAVTFAGSNQGFSQRQVAALVQDVKDPKRLYAGVVNDKMYGGVFTSGDDGKSWQQQSQGLDGRDVFSLAESPDGTLLAGTNRGIFVWQDGRWQAAGRVVQMAEKTTYTRRKGKRVKTTQMVAKPAGDIDGRVHGFDLTHGTWYAATSAGVFQSTDQGKVWMGGPVLGQTDYLSVHAMGPVVLATRRTGIAVSQDGGKTWQPEPLPGKLTTIRTSTIAPGGSMWIGGREGVCYSTDNGASWTFMSTLPISDINGIEYEGDLKRIVITSSSSTWVMAVHETDKSWKWWDAGWHVRGVRSNGGRLLAASLYNGVVMQPQGSGANQAVTVAAK